VVGGGGGRSEEGEDVLGIAKKKIRIPSTFQMNNLGA